MEVTVLRCFERSQAMFGDRDVHCSGVGGVGAAGDEFVGFQPGDHARNTALTERRAATQFTHPHRVIVGENRQEQQNLELVQAQTVFVLQRAIETADQDVASAYQAEERLCARWFEVLRAIGSLDHARRRASSINGGIGTRVHVDTISALACLRIHVYAYAYIYGRRPMTLTTETTTNPQQTRTQHGFTRAVVVAATTGSLAVASAIVNVGFGDVIHGPAFGESPPVDVGVGAVAAVTLLSTLAGWALLAILERWTTRPRTIWITSAIAVAIASLAPLLSNGTTAGHRAALAALHVLVAAIYIPLMSRTVNDQPGGRP